MDSAITFFFVACICVSTILVLRSTRKKHNDGVSGWGSGQYRYYVKDGKRENINVETPKEKSPEVRRYTSRKVMTNNEHEFYRRLLRARPRGFEVFSEMSMGAILKPLAEDIERRNSDFYHIASSRVDFVVWHLEKNEILLLIELDDKTHIPERDQARDALTKSAGLQTWRVQSTQKPSVEQIRARLLEEARRKYPPPAPNTPDKSQDTQVPPLSGEERPTS